MPTKLGSIISYIKYIRSLLMSEPCLSMFGGQMPTWPNWPTLSSRSRLPLAFDFCQVFMVRAKICWSALAVTFGIYTAFWCSLQFYKNSLLNSRMLHSRARTRTPSVPKQLSKSTPLWHWWTQEANRANLTWPFLGCKPYRGRRRANCYAIKCQTLFGHITWSSLETK